jgi:pullulanase/glycogen debranching enzyme
VNGTLAQDSLGLFQKPNHSVNYLESHDGYALGDFIRLGLGDVKQNEVIKDIDSNAKLTPAQLKLNKLAALFLFTSRGITMISEGQEFARSKVVPLNTKTNDPQKGKIDHNTYDKHNEVNFINYNYAKMNENLFNYYKGLIELRKEFQSFRRAEYEDVVFFEITDNPFAIGYVVNYKDETFIVLMNANPQMEEEFILPKGNWQILVNPEKAGKKSLGKIDGKIKVALSSGYVLKKS